MSRDMKRIMEGWRSFCAKNLHPKCSISDKEQLFELKQEFAQMIKKTMGVDNKDIEKEETLGYNSDEEKFLSHALKGENDVPSPVPSPVPLGKRSGIKDTEGREVFFLNSEGREVWRTYQDFNSPELLEMRKLHAKLKELDHEFVVPKGKEVALTLQRTDEEMAADPTLPREYEKKEKRWDIKYSKQIERELPTTVRDKFEKDHKEGAPYPKGYNTITGKMTRSENPMPILKILEKNKKELGVDFQKWKRLVEKNIESFMKGKETSTGEVSPSYETFTDNKGTSDYIIYSRHPIDIMRMSDMGSWTSCHTPSGDLSSSQLGYFRSAIKEAMGDGGAVVFYVNRDDLHKKAGGEKPSEVEKFLEKDEIFVDACRNIEGVLPYGRARIRRITKKMNGEGTPEEPGVKEVDFWVPEIRSYGEPLLGAMEEIKWQMYSRQTDRIFDFVNEMDGQMDGHSEKVNEFANNWELQSKEYYEKKKGELFEELSAIEKMEIPNDFGCGSTTSWKTSIDSVDAFYPTLLEKALVHSTALYINEKLPVGGDTKRFTDKMFKDIAKVKFHKHVYHIIPNIEKVTHPDFDDSELSKIDKEEALKFLISNMTTTLEENFSEAIKGEFLKRSSHLRILEEPKLKGGDYIDTPVNTLFTKLISTPFDNAGSDKSKRFEKILNNTSEEKNIKVQKEFFQKYKKFARNFELSTGSGDEIFDNFDVKTPEGFSEALNEKLREKKGAILSFFEQYTSKSFDVCMEQRGILKGILKRIQINREKGFDYLNLKEEVLEMLDVPAKVREVLRYGIHLPTFFKDINDSNYNGLTLKEIIAELSEQPIRNFLGVAYVNFRKNWRKMPGEKFKKIKSYFDLPVVKKMIKKWLKHSDSEGIGKEAKEGKLEPSAIAYNLFEKLLSEDLSEEEFLKFTRRNEFFESEIGVFEYFPKEPLQIGSKRLSALPKIINMLVNGKIENVFAPGTKWEGWVGENILSPILFDPPDSKVNLVKVVIDYLFNESEDKDQNAEKYYPQLYKHFSALEGGDERQKDSFLLFYKYSLKSKKPKEHIKNMAKKLKEMGVRTGFFTKRPDKLLETTEKRVNLKIKKIRIKQKKGNKK